MRSSLYAVIAVLLFGCATTPDPIDRIVAHLSADGGGGLWENGLYKPIDLPSAASPDQVVKRAIEMQGMTIYKIAQIRQVRINPDIFTAAYVHTSNGNKVVLFKYEGRGWWSRVYASV